MVAIIGGEPHRFRPLIDRYREAELRAGHSPDQLKVGIHSLGYVTDNASKAANEFFPGYARSFSEIGKERGWPPVTRAHFDALLGPTGALLVGDPETVAEKIVHMNDSLGGISRLTFQMSVAALPHAKLMRAIELLGTRVAPLVRTALASETAGATLLTNSQYKKNDSTEKHGRESGQNAEVTYNMIKIAIILGSTRPGRIGEAVAPWVYELAQKRSDAEFELVDIKDFNLPLLDEPVPPIDGPVLQGAHEDMGGEDRLLRRLRLRDARVQPRHLRRAQERDRFPLRRVEQQGGRLRRLRRRQRRARGRASASGDWPSCRSPPCATRSCCRSSPTSRTSPSSSPVHNRRNRSTRCSIKLIAWGGALKTLRKTST